MTEPQLAEITPCSYCDRRKKDKFIGVGDHFVCEDCVVKAGSALRRHDGQGTQGDDGLNSDSRQGKPEAPNRIVVGGQCDFCRQQINGDEVCATAPNEKRICRTCVEPRYYEVLRPKRSRKLGSAEETTMAAHIFVVRIFAPLLFLLTFWRPFLIPYYLVSNVRLGDSRSELTVLGQRTGMPAELISYTVIAVIHIVCLIVALYLVAAMLKRRRCWADFGGEYGLHFYGVATAVGFALLRTTFYFFV